MYAKCPGQSEVCRPQVPQYFDFSIGPYPQRVRSAPIHLVAQLVYGRDDYPGRREALGDAVGHLFCRVKDG